MSAGRESTLRVVIAGGGTAGHLYPGMAIHEALLESVADLEVLYMGARGGMEEKILSEQGRKAVLLPGYGLRGSSVVARIKAPFVLADAVRRAMSEMRSFRPDVVIGTGGYASAAAVIAAAIMRIPRVLQEQNSVPGLVNRRMARFADVVLLSYESSRRWIHGAKRVVTIGNPLRAMAPVNRAAAALKLGLEESRATVLVIGGSRGARSLNMAAADAAPALAREHGAQVLILAGSRDHEAMRSRIGSEAGGIHVMEYLGDVAAAYSIADVAVARAGASSVFELASFGVPTVFVPYPHAADGHQELNVAQLARENAACVIPDEELTGERLAGEISGLLTDGERRQRMSRALRAWAPVDAASRAAAEVIEAAKKKNVARPVACISQAWKV